MISAQAWYSSTTMKFTTYLNGLGACQPSIDWCEANGITTADEAWRKCDRGDWMLWLAGKMAGPVDSESRKKLVFACAQCARLVLPIFEKQCPDDKRVRTLLEVSEAYSYGKATLKSVHKARSACAYAAYTSADAAAYAASAAYATYACACAAYAYAAYASAACACSALAANAPAAARNGVLKQCADIVRSVYPSIPNDERQHA